MLEKTKQSKVQTHSAENKNSRAFNLVSSLIESLNENDDFAIDHQKTLNVRDTKVSRTPITTEINEVVVNKVKITEAQEIVFEDKDQNKYSARGHISYGEEKQPVSPKELAFLQDTKKIEAERLTYLKRTLRDQNKYFFRVKNHEEFYQMGRSYHEDFKNGQKLFLFSHLNAAYKQQESVLGVASFLQYFENVKVLIISSNLGQGLFKKILPAGSAEELRVTARKTNTAQFIFHEGMTFLDAESIKVRRASDQLTYEQVISHLYRLFDVILYDLPEVSKEKAYLDFYFPIYSVADSVSLVFAKNASTFSGVNEKLHHFNSYKVKIKGALMADETGDKF